MKMNKYLIKLLYKRQALQVFCEVSAAWVVLVHDAQARHAITKVIMFGEPKKCSDYEITGSRV